MDVDGPNPSFPRAIPHGMLIIDYLTKGVLFGLFPGCPRVVSREGLQSPPEGIFGGCLGAPGKDFPRFEQLEPSLLGTHARERKLISASIANGNSAIRTRTRALPRTPTNSSSTSRTPSRAELPLHFFSGKRIA